MIEDVEAEAKGRAHRNVPQVLLAARRSFGHLRRGLRDSELELRDPKLELLDSKLNFAPQSWSFSGAQILGDKVFSQLTAAESSAHRNVQQH